MLENIRLSLKGIVTHKMRSALTMLGIIIGIASIIMIVSIIQGATASLKNDMIGGNANTITMYIYDKKMSYEPYSTSEGKIPGISTISEESIENVKKISGVMGATPIYLNSNIGFGYNESTTYGSIYGVEKDYFNMQKLVLMSGRLLTAEDYEKKNNVVVISAEAESTLFSNESSIGKTLTIGEDLFVVVGVVTTIHDYGDINSFSDYVMKVGLEGDKIYVPSTSWNLVGGYDDIQGLVVQLEDVDDSVRVATLAANVLNEKIVSDEFEYKSDSLNEDAEYLETITNIASILLIGIASISLIVGGIGVMNIMLVSVTERTKEIGLKKALGAKNKVILSQFLTESVVLTSVGGIIGVLIGIGLAYIISLVAGLPMAISVPAIIISVAFSMIVGIVFGLIPSVKASKLDPIEALRYE